MLDVIKIAEDLKLLCNKNNIRCIKANSLDFFIGYDEDKNFKVNHVYFNENPDFSKIPIDDLLEEVCKRSEEFIKSGSTIFLKLK